MNEVDLFDHLTHVNYIRLQIHLVIHIFLCSVTLLLHALHQVTHLKQTKN